MSVFKKNKKQKSGLETESSVNKALSMQAAGPKFGPQHPCGMLGLGVKSCDPHTGVVETEGSLRLAKWPACPNPQ